MKKRVVCVIARQRSGTNLLRNVLSGMYDLVDYEEVFTKCSVPASYFAFNKLTDMSESDAFRNADARKIANYIDQICQLEIDRKILLDIKYNQTRIASDWSSSLFDLTPPLQGLAKHGPKIVHLIRSNVIETIVSQLVADATGIFHIRDQVANSHRPSPIKVRLNAGDVRTELRKRRMEINFFRSYLASYFGDVVEIEYEWLVSRVNARDWIALDKAIALTYDGSKEPMITFTKSIKSWRDCLENGDEIDDVVEQFNSQFPPGSELN